MTTRRPPRPPRRSTARTPRPTGRATQPQPHPKAHAQDVFEHTTDAIVLLTLDGVLETVNRGAERLLGRAREDLIGQPLRTVATPAAVAVVEVATQRVRAGAAVPATPFTAELLHNDGRVVPVEARLRLIQDAAGRPSHWQGFFRDVTEHQRMQAALAQSQERYRAIVDACPDLVYVTDTAGHLLDANPALLEWQGMTLAELQQRHFLDFFAGDNEAELMTAFARLTQGLPVRELLLKAKNGQGEVREYEINARPLHDPQGRVTAVLSIARDVTARRAAERALHESQRLRERIAEAIPELMYVYDVRAQQTRVVNRRVTALLGYLPDEVQGQTGPPFGDLVHPEDRATCVQRMQDWATLEAGEMLTSEYRVRHTSGEYRWLASRETVLTRGPEGEPQEMVGLARDITEHKRLLQVARQRTVALSAVGQRLQRFRESLRMTQAEFGAYLGGYNQHHISSYETGRSEVPLELLLRMSAKGHPLEAVLGEGATDALEDTIVYLAASYRERVVSQRLAQVLAQLLGRDLAKMERVLRAMERPTPGLSTAQQRLLEQLIAIDKLTG